MGQTILYLDPWTGVSGDMLLAALLDTDRAGGRLDEHLRSVVDALGVPGAAVEIVRDVEWGVACTRVTVQDGGYGPLRRLADMERVIAASACGDSLKAKAVAALRRLASVEAAVHGCSVDHIHFHEVGAVDTLVDVVGVLALVEAVGAQRVVVGPIPVGGGTVQIAHGRMGVPAPATARLLEGYCIVGGPEMRELTTPTGALLVRELGAVSGSLPRLSPAGVGYGAGSMKLESGPNLLRVVLGTDDGPDFDRLQETKGDHDAVVELQTNLDDVSAEVVAHACDALRRAGALDVWTTSAHMKKGRPGLVLHALVEERQSAAVVAAVFEGTGTLGVRWQRVTRCLAERGTVDVTVDGARVGVKWGRWRGRLTSVSPEYEDAAAAATQLGLSLREVMLRATVTARVCLSPTEQGERNPASESEEGDDVPA